MDIVLMSMFWPAVFVRGTVSNPNKAADATTAHGPTGAGLREEADLGGSRAGPWHKVSSRSNPGRPFRSEMLGDPDYGFCCWAAPGRPQNSSEGGTISFQPQLDENHSQFTMANLQLVGRTKGRPHPQPLQNLFPRQYWTATSPAKQDPRIASKWKVAHTSPTNSLPCAKRRRAKNSSRTRSPTTPMQNTWSKNKSRINLCGWHRVSSKSEPWEAAPGLILGDPPPPIGPVFTPPIDPH